MKPEKDPEVIDLQRYRKANKPQPAPVRPPARPKASNASMLGDNPHAKTILVIVAIVAIGLFVVPMALQVFHLVKR